MTKYESILREHNISPSVQRLAILEFLCNNNNHPTVEEIFNNLNKSLGIISKTTIYNTLKFFEKNNIVQELHFNKSIAHYDIILKPHNHFVCSQCGKIYDLFNYENTDINMIDNHLIKEKSVTYYGTCENCLGKGKKNA